MANRPGKHSAPLNSGTSRRGAHSAPLGSAQERRRSPSAPITSAGRSTRSAQAARSRSAQADVSRTPRTSRARSSFEGTGFAPTASPVSAAGGSQSFAATDSLARAKAARKKSRGKKIALGIAAALVVVLAGAGTALALYLNGINATIRDKYFSGASATPAAVFPVLVNLAQKHLKKLNAANRGLSIAYEKQMTELLSKLGTEYPAHLNLRQQGSFQLGYYFQTQARYQKKEEK